MNRQLLLAACLVLIPFAHGCTIQRTDDEGADGTDIQTAVHQMLDESAVAWNSGVIEGFMDDYLDAPTTTYIGGSGLIIGYEGIRGRYAPLFSQGAERDSLRFESLRVRGLGPLYGLATARWVLHRDGVVTGSGPFTLVLRRTGTAWQIIHDHSSSDPASAAPEQ